MLIPLRSSRCFLSTSSAFDRTAVYSFEQFTFPARSNIMSVLKDAMRRKRAEQAAPQYSQQEIADAVSFVLDSPQRFDDETQCILIENPAAPEHDYFVTDDSRLKYGAQLRSALHVNHFIDIFMRSAAI